MRVVAVLLAAGSGTRFGGDKTRVALAGRPLWRHAYDRLLRHPRVDGVGIVTSAQNLEDFQPLAPEAEFVVAGGATRQASSRIGVEAAQGDVILIHDAARPHVSEAVIDRVLDGIGRTGAAAAAIPVTDTIRRIDESDPTLVDRTNLLAMQTPQGARRELLLAAHAAATDAVTDDMELLAQAGIPYELVPGDPANLKVTTIDDLRRLQAPEFRTGFGYDIHRFSNDPARPCVLGGVRFEGETGLEGHSDADVVLHAVMDALLGAAALGDIGQHFPNTDTAFAGADSRALLRRVAELVCAEGWTIANLDATYVGERPKVMRRATEMRSAIAEALGIEVGRVSLKATTNERLGAVGREEGAAAFASALLTR